MPCLCPVLVGKDGYTAVDRGIYLDVGNMLPDGFPEQWIRIMDQRIVRVHFKDFKRSVDFLETREDIDSNRIAYYGMSWGGAMGAIIPAVEDRLKASVLLPGVFDDMGRPEVNQINYISRVTVPTLMLGGDYDTISPVETAMIPMYNFLGTPDEDKELKLYPTDHIPPLNDVIRETLDWLDKYLGPVNR